MSPKNTEFCFARVSLLEKNDWGGGGQTRIAWPKATARGRVREWDVPPPARSVKLKLPPFYKVNGKLKRGPLIIIICNCSCCVNGENFFPLPVRGGICPKYTTLGIQQLVSL